MATKQIFVGKIRTKYYRCSVKSDSCAMVTTAAREETASSE